LSMAFVKIIKNKAWFKRFQVKKRRRREGKTDYQARRRMVRQDKNKFNSRKYRLVVRFTNSQCICQVIYATICGDRVVTQATTKELAKYGVPCGHTNYAAAYCAGLLIARRTLKKFGLDDMFKGKETLDGEEYHVEDEESDQRPFKAILDVGRQSTTVGARLWGALKGAVDGGLHVPHTQKNFPGYKPAEEKGAEAEYDHEAHKERIFGKHVQEYMEMLQEEDPTKYEAHFSRFLKDGIEPDGLEEVYSKAHAAIRANPEYEPKEKKNLTHERSGNKITTSDGKEHMRSVKLSLRQRREKVRLKIAAAQAKAMEE